MNKGTTPAFSHVEQGYFVKSTSANIIGNEKVSELYGRYNSHLTHGTNEPKASFINGLSDLADYVTEYKYADSTLRDAYYDDRVLIK